MFAITVEFLTGRYVGTAYNSRSEGEWPPHPARLFSALVATHYEAEAPSTTERTALEWLEAAPPPAIAASDCSTREVTTVYVPVNDTHVVNGLEDTEKYLADAEENLREPGLDSKERTRREKALAKERTDAAATIAKAIAQPVNQEMGDAAKGLAVRPDTRPRRARTFPSVTPDDPVVTFVWPLVPPAPIGRALADLATRVVRLGHSSSFVAVRVVEKPPEARWRPDAMGERVLRVVRPGQLQSLERAFERHRSTEPRVLPSDHQPYTELPNANESLTMVRSRFSDRWLVLARSGSKDRAPLRVPMQAGVGVARSVRRALMQYGEDPLPAMLTGHEQDGRPGLVDHLAIVPLPFLGHQHADGSLLGVALVLPSQCPASDREAIARALRRWEEAQPQRADGRSRIPVLLGSAGILELERTAWDERRRNLLSETWCQPSRTWSSVTPVALDQHPGDLWARDGASQREAQAQASKTISAACGRIGLPEPQQIELLPHAPWAGASKARDYPAFTGGNNGPRRMLTHVRIRFELPVQGPILLGAGRFHGLGLMRPEAPTP